MTTEKTIERAHLALPHLVESAKRRKTITYGELGAKIGIHPRAVSHLLYYIRDEVCRPQGLPMLTAIVVHKSDELPGESWLPEGTQRLSEEEGKRRFEEVCEQVFAYKSWDALLHELGLLPLPGTGEGNHGEVQPDADDLSQKMRADNGPAQIRKPTESEEISTKLILAEYDRVAALERARMEYMEKILQSYIAIASAVVAAVLFVAEKGPSWGIPFTAAEGLLLVLLGFGGITFFRMVNSNIMLIGFMERFELLRGYFEQKDDELYTYFPQSLTKKPEELKKWASVLGILRRVVTKGGSKGYQATITIFNSFCAGVVADTLASNWLQASSFSLLPFLAGATAFVLVGFLHVIYASYRYNEARRQIEFGTLTWFL